MSPSTESSRPIALWKGLSDDRRFEAAVAFWNDPQAMAEQAEAVGLIARQINFRPKSVLLLPVEKRARHLVRLARLSDAVAGRLLVSYHLTRQRPMMASFLDALGIAHEDGLISAEQVAPPGREAIEDAAGALAAAYPVEDIRLYFATLVMQDPDTWGGLTGVLPVPADERAAT
jgi:hypothetical protein